MAGQAAGADGVEALAGTEAGAGMDGLASNSKAAAHRVRGIGYHMRVTLPMKAPQATDLPGTLGEAVQPLIVEG